MKKSSNFAFIALVFSILTPKEALSKANEALIALLIRNGDVEGAYYEVANSNPHPADLLFFRALVEQANRNYAQAIALLSQTIEANPNHINARRELARTLFLQGSYRLAERRFQKLLLIDQSQEMHSIYKGYIKEIHRRRPLAIFGNFSILPSSNINRGTENLLFDTNIGQFVIDPSSQRVSGIGAQGGLTGSYRFLSNGQSRNTILWNLNGTLYEQSIFNSATASLRFSHETPVNQTTVLGFGLSYRYTWREDSADNRALGLHFSLLNSLSPRDRLRFDIDYEQIEFSNQPYNTGPFAQLDATYIHQHSPSLSYSFETEFSRRETNARHSAYSGAEVSTSIRNEWSGGYIGSISLNAGARAYDGEFPLTGEIRGDRYYGISISVQNRNWTYRGFSPRISCSYIKNFSNIAFYQYDATECNVGINRRF